MDRLRLLLARIRAYNCFSSSHPRPVPVDPNSKLKSPSLSVSSARDPPTSVVVAHGAFHTTWHYQAFVDAVHEKTNLDRVLVPQQSSSSPNPPDDSFDADVRLLRGVVADELRAGRDVLLVCHSYGGIPGCDALTDLPVGRSRETEDDDDHHHPKPGRILGIIFVSAFVAEAGQSLVTCKLADRASWVRTENHLSYVHDPEPTLYHLVHPATTRHDLARRLVPQSSATFVARAAHESWRHHPTCYIRCLHDRAMAVPEQDHFVARLRRRASPTSSPPRVHDLPSDHAPFASMPERLAVLVDEIGADFRALRS